MWWCIPQSPMFCYGNQLWMSLHTWLWRWQQGVGMSVCSWLVGNLLILNISSILIFLPVRCCWWWHCPYNVLVRLFQIQVCHYSLYGILQGTWLSLLLVFPFILYTNHPCIQYEETNLTMITPKMAPHRVIY